VTAPTPRQPGRLDVEELADWRRQGVAMQIIDVREPWEVDICALADAVKVPLASLPGRLDAIATDLPLVLVCHHGARSQSAVNFLLSRGYGAALNLSGGIDAWARRVELGMAVY